MNHECPVCGSKNLERIDSKETLKGDLGKEKTFARVTYKCGDCESEGDFFDENTASVNTALAELKKEYVNSTLNYFSENKIHFSSIERVLNLPQRTLTKWKNDASTPTAAGVALLKFLRLYPWLLDVAEHGFDYDISQKIFIKSAINAMMDRISFYQNGFMENVTD